MLTLWYIVLGWKEYNKPFRRAEQPAKSVEPAKKPDLIPPRKDGPTLPTDIKKPEPPKSIPIDQRPLASRDPAMNNRNPDTPKISDVQPGFHSLKSPEVPKTPSIPKMPETPKMPEPPKVSPKTPETPKMPEPPKVSPKTPETPKMPEPPKVSPKTPETPKMPESPKIAPKTPDFPKTPETPKMPESPKVAPKIPDFPKTPELPKVLPRTPEAPKIPELKLAPERPKKPDILKTPESPNVTPKALDSPKVPDSPNLPEGLKPSRRPESVMPEFPPSGKNPYFPQPNPSEFDLPPYLPGTPQNKPLSRDDELFALGNNFNSPSPNKPMGNLRDLSYAKGEFPGENVAAKGQEVRLPRYMEQSLISNPDSLESDEEDEDV